MGKWNEVVEVERGTNHKQLGSSLKNSSKTDSKTSSKSVSKNNSKNKTGNSEARRLAGITPKDRREYLRDRRRSKAILTIEVTKELKAELLMAAKSNGTSLKEEVTKRIVAYDPDS